MTSNADLMYDTRPPSSYRYRIILGDGSIKIGLVHRHNVLATGGGCTDFIAPGIYGCGVLGLLEVSVSAILCRGSL